ncbi:hypothetical protein OROHE_018470 [Orobanche hederae]
MAAEVLRPWWFDGHIAGNFNSGQPRFDREFRPGYYSW